MPIYEYHCSQCNQNFEYLVIGKEDPQCPTCDTRKVTRLMSACGFVSKGGGGETVKASAADSACSGCAATNCSTCGA
jgi:putative FmdB family regulatory protein